MLIKSARRTVNPDYVAEAAFYEGEVCEKIPMVGELLSVML